MLPAAWLRLGILYGRQLDHHNEAAAFAEAESLYRSLSNLEGVTDVLYQRAVLANRIGKASEASALLKQAEEMARSTGSVHQRIVILLQIEQLRPSHERHCRSRARCGRGPATRDNGLENLTTRGLVDLGNTYFIRGEYDEAAKLFTRSLEYARRYHSGRNEARALLSLGSLVPARRSR